ncbi:hypothetical protein MexAM1_META1p1000 [Methylorubrum extorquens AM1]|uniref:Uncharacterized protein n=1 Tax=Methylorubrum extorquens (strain ATCC 14718 / DSM 1338 / JCM 2805 / NCIMB 9133 / AM1) TaxID=272630 RepID=C5AX56_METEA|nr:hypothetical protein MexAM1_META1p1000 [Methylorubrum extorquens AM1]
MLPLRTRNPIGIKVDPK